MITLLGYSFSYLGLLLSLMTALFIVTQLSWWLLGQYFPNTTFCMAVHKNLGKWFDKERKVLALLEIPTVFGVLSSILLSGIILLNVTLLSQIFELFVPPGERINIPFIGKFATFPLMVGFLYALVEVAFSAIYELKKANKEPTRALAWVIGIIIVVEAGLNYFRSLLIIWGQLPPAPTLWDQITLQGGSALAGFLGFIVPLAVIYLGRYSVVPAVLPLTKNLAILIRFVSSNILLGLVWFYFGFHNKKAIILPGPVSRLVTLAHKLTKDAGMLNEKLVALQNLAAELKERPENTGDIEQKIHELDSKIQNLETTWTLQEPDYTFTVKNGLNNVDKMIDTARDKRNKSMLRQAIHTAKRWIKNGLADLDIRKKELVSINDMMEKTPNQYTDWQKKYDKYQTELEKVKALETAFSKQLQDSQLRSLCDSIEAALGHRTLATSSLDQADTEELQRLTRPPQNLDKYEKIWLQELADACKSVVQTTRNKLNEIEAQFEYFRSILAGLDKKNLEMSSCNERNINSLSSMLLAFDNRLEQLEQDIQTWWSISREKLQNAAMQMLALFIFLSLVLSRKQRA